MENWACSGLVVANRHTPPFSADKEQTKPQPQTIKSPSIVHSLHTQSEFKEFWLFSRWTTERIQAVKFQHLSVVNNWVSWLHSEGSFTLFQQSGEHVITGTEVDLRLRWGDSAVTVLPPTGVLSVLQLHCPQVLSGLRSTGHTESRPQTDLWFWFFLDEQIFTLWSSCFRARYDRFMIFDISTHFPF